MDRLKMQKMIIQDMRMTDHSQLYKCWKRLTWKMARDSATAEDRATRQVMGVNKVSNSRSDLQGHSRAFAMVSFHGPHTIFYYWSNLNKSQWRYRPRSGPIFDRYRKDKAAYRHKVRNKQRQEKQIFTNELHEALLQKQGKTFWKCWVYKLERGGRSINHVNGVTDHAAIAEHFCRISHRPVR